MHFFDLIYLRDIYFVFVFSREAEWWAGFAPLIGTAWVFMSALFFTISNLIVQLCKNVDPLNLAVYRFFGIFLPLLPIIVYKRYNLFPKGKKKK